MDEIWITVRESGGRKSVAKLSFYDSEEDGGDLKWDMNEPEIIGSPASINHALDLITFFHPLRKKK